MIGSPKNLQDFRSPSYIEEGEDDNHQNTLRECISKIVGTLSFRKLAGKTQVILSINGPDVRTRLTHTMEVAKIARDLCQKLKLNAELAEAIALAHDIGHTPFGHVGERTLRDIMCGCNTLGGKVPDHDFSNSGFKHNLQGFRVLVKDLKINLNEGNNSRNKLNIEHSSAREFQVYETSFACSDSNCTQCKQDRMNECYDLDAQTYAGPYATAIFNNFDYLEYDNQTNINSLLWPYILWGVLVHTDMTYAKKREIGNQDNDIFISSSLCSRIFNCYYHPTHQCRRNIIDPKLREERICKPWFCAILGNENGELPQGKRKYLSCEEQCYMARLWKSKIHNRTIFRDLQFLFDHPFPNIFFADFLNHTFLATERDWVSLEALIVSQADEIAQRRQDLDDAVNKELLSMDKAKEIVFDLIKAFKKEEALEPISKKVDKCRNIGELGPILTSFYQELLIKTSLDNMHRFADPTILHDVNIYSLMSILYRNFVRDYGKERAWILHELNNLTANSSLILRKNDYFEWNNNDDSTKRARELYLIAHELLELGVKLGFSVGKINPKFQRTEYEYDTELLQALVNSINRELALSSENGNNDDQIECSDLRDKVAFLNTLGQIESTLIKKPGDRKKPPEMRLFHYYVLHRYFIMKKDSQDLFTTQDLSQVLSTLPGLIEEYSGNAHREGKKREFFRIWTRYLKMDSHKALCELVSFIRTVDTKQMQDEQEEKLKSFAKLLSKSIIKSEVVEKNDGKGDFILRRLFKAYLTNPHQLPNSGLGWILRGMSEKYDVMVEDARQTFARILNRQRSSLHKPDKEKQVIIDKIISLTFDEGQSDEIGKFKDMSSNEIRALWADGERLIKFLDELEKGPFSNDDFDTQEVQKSFREGFDNVILHATPTWRSILIRGICDHIAGLTDLEAISEYEKLYTGVMELV